MLRNPAFQVLTERLDVRGTRAEIKVFQSNSGRFIAEYKLGTVRFPLPIVGRTAIEAMAAAKKWLTTSIGAR